MSPYIERLGYEASIASDQYERARLEALVGCYWARVGNFEVAEDIRARLREVYGSGESASVSITLMMLDALLHFFRDQSAAAHGRAKAAHLLATSCRLRREQAFTGAWLAHFEFNRNNWRSTVEALDSAQVSVDRHDVATQARICQIVTDAHLLVGDEALARSWQGRARLLMTGLGDHAAIEALLCNWAALRIHNARLDPAPGAVEAATLQTLGGEIASAANYQRLAQLSSLDYLLTVSQASHRVLAEDWTGAKSALQTLLARADMPAASNLHAQVHADLARCLIELGEGDAAKTHAATAERYLGAGLSADDAAVVAESLAEYYGRAGQSELSEKMQALQLQQLSEHRTSMLSLKSAFSSWAADPAQVLSQPSSP